MSPTSKSSNTRPVQPSFLANRALPAPLESVTLTLPGLGSDSSLLGAAEIALEPLFVDPVAALGTALVGVGTRLAG